VLTTESTASASNARFFAVGSPLVAAVGDDGDPGWELGLLVSCRDATCISGGRWPDLLPPCDAMSDNKTDL